MTRNARPARMLVAFLYMAGLADAVEPGVPLLEPPTAEEVAKVADAVSCILPGLGLDGPYELRPRSGLRDRGGMIHVRFQEYFRGDRVLGGELVAHWKEGTIRSLTDRLRRDLPEDLEPVLRIEDVRASVEAGVRGEAPEPSVERVWQPVLERVRIRSSGKETQPNAADFERVAKGARLAYLVGDAALELGGRSYPAGLIDAVSGAPIDAWDEIERGGPYVLVTRTPRFVTGRTQYSGTAKLNATHVHADSAPIDFFELVDPTRGKPPGNRTLDMWDVNVFDVSYDPIRGGDSRIRNELLRRFQDPDYPIVKSGSPVFGNGRLYAPDLPEFRDHETRETSAADAHFGVQATWDLLRNVFGRNGPDGEGRPVTVRVHSSLWYLTDDFMRNACWDGERYSITIGNGGEKGGALFWAPASLDTVAHELAHGLNQAGAGLGIWCGSSPSCGEARGLSEASSDIFGTLAEHYVRLSEAHGAEIPDSPRYVFEPDGSVPGSDVDHLPNWTIGEQWRFKIGPLSQSLPATSVEPGPRWPIRYMYKPSLDGESPNKWHEGLRVLDGHYSCGPMSRAFFFLAHGVSSDPESATGSALLPEGMVGIGLTRAARLWYHVLMTRLGSDSDYDEARRLCLESVPEALASETDLAPGELERQIEEVKEAVENAFAAVNVGLPSRR